MELKKVHLGKGADREALGEGRDWEFWIGGGIFTEADCTNYRLAGLTARDSGFWVQGRPRRSKTAGRHDSNRIAL